MAKIQSRFLKICVSIGALIAIVLVGLFIAAPTLIERHYFSPQERIAFRAWSNDKIHLPAEALSAPPFQAATQQSARKFSEAWNNQKNQAELLINDLQGTGPESRKQIDPETLDYPNLEQRLNVLQPMMNAFAELVSQADYTIEASASGRDYDDRGVLPFPEFLAIQTNIKLLGLRSNCQVHNGKYDDAERALRLMLRATRADSYDRAISSLIAIGGASITADAWIYLVRHCDDKPLLRRMLEEQIEQTRHPILFPAISQVDTLDKIGCLRQLKRRGIVSDYQDKTGFELHIMEIHHESEYIEKILLPLVQNDPEKTKAALKELEWRRKVNLSDPIMRTIIRYDSYDIAKMDDNAARTRAMFSAAKLDLLTLETAKKLFTLEHGKPPATFNDLVPQYIPHIFRDQLGSAEALKATPDRYYSIGPDKVDDHAMLSYDPTNGSLSSGDLFFEN